MVTVAELKRWVDDGQVWRKLLRYKAVRLRVPRLEALPRPFLAAVLLRLLSRGAAVIEDDRSRRQRIGLREIALRLLNLLRDAFRRRSVLSTVRREVVELGRMQPGAGRAKGLSPAGGRPVYLRTDLWFGVRSGGSVGHIAGVLNQLDQFAGRPLFVTTDRIPTVRADIETRVFAPQPRYWDFAEIPSFYFNQTLYPFLKGQVVKSDVAFVYQRYSRNNYCGLKLARDLQVPFALEYNGSEAWMSRNWGHPLRHEKLTEAIELLNLRGADLVVVVSRAMLDELVGRGVERERILVNPNGVDPVKYSPAVEAGTLRRKLGLEGTTVIGFIGTFGRWHGAEVLAEAFGRLLARWPECRDRVRLLMIGDGLTMPEVKESLRNNAVEGLTRLVGLLPQEEGPVYLAACDVLVASHVPNPDGSPFFGSPTKLFEYMAMGKGIVASNLDQIGEVLDHDRTAWLVEPGDPEALAQGLQRLVDDPALRRRLGQAARRAAVAGHTWREHTRRIVERLRELHP